MGRRWIALLLALAFAVVATLMLRDARSDAGDAAATGIDVATVPIEEKTT